MVPALIDERIKQDHREIFAWYDAYQATRADPKEAEKWKNQFVYEVARHSVSEEIVMYPALEKYALNGKALADEARKEHDQVKADLYLVDLHKVKDCEDYDKVIAKVAEELRVHIEKEEREDLPALMNSLPAGEAERMASSFERTKYLVPTHPHTAAPSTGGIGEQLMGLLVKPMDTIRDVLRTFPTKEERDSALAMYEAKSGKAVM